MNKERKEENQSHQGLDASHSYIKKHNTEIYKVDSGLSTLNGLHLLSATLQVFLGTVVVALSIIDLIQPAWVASLVTIVGCVSIISGLLFFYNIFSKDGSFDSLVNKAIKRVITFQN